MLWERREFILAILVTSEHCIDMTHRFAWPIQGLIRHFRPELEAKMLDYSKIHGGEALAGGWEPDAGRQGKLVSPGM